MKGIVFTEFFSMVEAVFSAEMVDDIINDCDLSTNGAYTSVGTYPHTELLQLVSALSHHSDIPVKDLVYKYGYHLFGRFGEIMPQFFDHPQNTFDFLEGVHNTIHVEVRKIYPDASLPNFKTYRDGEDKFTMVYESQCPFADFAHGLIGGCIDYYKENITITFKDQNVDGLYSRIFYLERA